MDVSFLLRGILIGFMVAVPVGPVGVLCVNRFLNEGIRAGLVSGLGVATADGLAATAALLGLTLVTGFLVNHQESLRLLAGVLLCYAGAKTMMSRPAAKSAPSPRVGSKGLLGFYLSTFLLTLANPVTISSFVAVFVGFGIAAESLGSASAGLLLAGVFLGSALWWLIWSVGQRLFPETISSRRLWWFNKVSGLTIAGFGCFLLIKP